MAMRVSNTKIVVNRVVEEYKKHPVLTAMKTMIDVFNRHGNQLKSSALQGYIEQSGHVHNTYICTHMTIHATVGGGVLCGVVGVSAFL